MISTSTFSPVSVSVGVAAKARMSVRALHWIAVPAALWAAACGDATEPAEPINQTPVVAGTVPAQSVIVGESIPVDMAFYFTDPDGDTLTYTAASSDVRIASVSMVGSVVTVSAITRGDAVVRITARDPAGLLAELTFPVTVPNQAPVAADIVPAQSVIVGESIPVDMAFYFTDPDGDTLTYTAVSSAVRIASVSMVGSVVTVSAIARGDAVVRITARDPAGLLAELTFLVTVPNRAPVVASAVPAQSMLSGEMIEVDVASNFTDPDGDELTYTVTATSRSHVVSISVAGSMVTLVSSRLHEGTPTITVTASDPGGLSAQLTFLVTVSQYPNVTGTYNGSFTLTSSTTGTVRTGTMSMDVVQSGSQVTVSSSMTSSGEKIEFPVFSDRIDRTGLLQTTFDGGWIGKFSNCQYVALRLYFSGQTAKYTEDGCGLILDATLSR